MPTPGITVYTALCIANNPVLCQAGGPDKDGKWTGWIMKDEDRWSPLLNSQPIYESHDAAVKAMEEVVKAIRANPPANPLDSLEPQLADTVRKVVTMAKEGLQTAT